MLAQGREIYIGTRGGILGLKSKPFCNKLHAGTPGDNVSYLAHREQYFTYCAPVTICGTRVPVMILHVMYNTNLQYIESFRIKIFGFPTFVPKREEDVFV
jgi:hypothetical protein